MKLDGSVDVTYVNVITKFGCDQINITYRNALLKIMLTPRSLPSQYTKYDQALPHNVGGSKHGAERRDRCIHMVSVFILHQVDTHSLHEGFSRLKYYRMCRQTGKKRMKSNQSGSVSVFFSPGLKGV